MPVVNQKATDIADAEGIPGTFATGVIAAVPPLVEMDVLGFTSTDSAASVYQYFRIPSNAIVTDVLIMNDPLGVTGYKVGVLATAQDGGGTVVPNSDRVLASNLDLTSAHATWTSIYQPWKIGDAAPSIANVPLRLWQLLGLSADPFKYYNVAITATNAAVSSGNVALRVLYAK